MRNIFIVTVIVILFVLIFFNIFIFRSLRVKNANLVINLYSAEHKTEELKGMLSNYFKFEGKVILENNIFTESDELLEIDSIFIKSPLIVFRFSKLNCTDCIVESINIIKSFLSNKRIKYIFISDYNNKRELGNFKRLNNIHEDVHNCNILINEEPSLPYFFILDSNLKVSDIFFPNDDFPELTNLYLKEIEQKYFKL